MKLPLTYNRSIAAGVANAPQALGALTCRCPEARQQHEGAGTEFSPTIPDKKFRFWVDVVGVEKIAESENT
jgi:hypothetical protein